LDLQPPLVVDDLGGGDLEAVQAEQPGGRGTTVLTHLGPPVLQTSDIRKICEVPGLFLSGLADLSALELGARLIGEQALVDRNRSMGSDGRHSLNESTSYRPLLPVEDLRRLRPGEGVLLYGHLRPTPVRLRPFYAPREQARRDRAEQRAARRLARAQRRLGRKTERAFTRMQRRRLRVRGQAATARIVWPERKGGRR
jgi:hypothetical protein